MHEDVDDDVEQRDAEHHGDQPRPPADLVPDPSPARGYDGLGCFRLLRYVGLGPVPVIAVRGGTQGRPATSSLTGLRRPV